jgi:hypothetical protein
MPRPRCGGYGRCGRWRERERDERERAQRVAWCTGLKQGVLVHFQSYRGEIVYKAQVEIAKVTCTNLGILLAVG